MIGMVMRIDNGVNLADPFAQELDAHLGAGVNQQVSAGQLKLSLPAAPTPPTNPAKDS